MKPIAVLRLKFEHEWIVLAHDLLNAHEECASSKDRDPWPRWESRFDSMLTDMFWDVFEEAKKSLEPRPAEFTYKTVRDWCLAENASSTFQLLNDLECHSFRWEAVLRGLEHCVASDLLVTDMIFGPRTTLCLETIAGLPSRSRDLRRTLSQIHPHLTSQRIHLRRVWVNNMVVDRMKTERSAAPATLGPILAVFLQQWHQQTSHGKPDDWIFASSGLKGRQPWTASILAADHLRPAAVAAGIALEP